MEIKAALAGGHLMLGKIQTLGNRIFFERPTLSPGERKMLIVKAIL
jgi:hypothetical protein